MYKQANNISEIEVSFPGSVFSPRDVRNYTLNGIPVLSEEFAVPDSLHAVLDYVPMAQDPFAITVDDEARTTIPFEETPGPTEVAVSFVNGEVRFHSADEGLTANAVYTGKGTDLNAFIVNTLGAELEAVESYILGDLANSVANCVIAPASTDNRVARFNGSAGQIQTSPVTLSDAGSFTGVANLTASGFISGNSLTVTTSPVTINSYALTVSGNANVNQRLDTNASPTFINPSATTYKASNGTVSNPAFNGGASNPVTGVWFPGSNLLGFSSNGVKVFEAGPYGANVTSGSFYVAGTQRISSSGIFGATVGSAGAPPYGFSSDSDTGMYRPGTNSLGLTTGGTLRVVVTSAGCNVVSGALISGPGTLGAPGITFHSDSDTGIYRSGADSFALVSGAESRIAIGAGLTFDTKDGATNGSDIGISTGDGTSGIGGSITIATGYGGTKDGSLTIQLNQAINQAGDLTVSAYDVTFNLDHNFILANLPTSDPSVLGALWNDSGTLKISV